MTSHTFCSLYTLNFFPRRVITLIYCCLETFFFFSLPFEVISTLWRNWLYSNFFFSLSLFLSFWFFRRSQTDIFAFWENLGYIRLQNWLPAWNNGHKYTYRYWKLREFFFFFQQKWISFYFLDDVLKFLACRIVNTVWFSLAISFHDSSVCIRCATFFFLSKQCLIL